jgi:hypothetical protein
VRTESYTHQAKGVDLLSGQCFTGIGRFFLPQVGDWEPGETAFFRPLGGGLGGGFASTLFFARIVRLLAAHNDYPIHDKIYLIHWKGLPIFLIQLINWTVRVFSKGE